jgi:hypothetical protein
VNANSDQLNALDLEALAWDEFQTVLVFGRVRQAVWWPPIGEIPGVLAARYVDQARELLERIQVEVSR